VTGARLFVLVLTLILAFPSQSAGHALEPGYLEITKVAGDSYRVYWRKPDVSGAPMNIDAYLPGACRPASGPAPVFDGQAWGSAWITTCPQGLANGRIGVDGLEAQQTDVLVRYRVEEDRTQSWRLTPDASSFVVPDDPGAYDVFLVYVPLGIEHILEGVDHLLFVFALLLLISDRWKLVGAITAFTVAHSITMTVATLSWVTLPGPPVEAVIALSIMFLASELAQQDGTNKRLSELYPWTVSFSFGLLHGFGFAGALKEIGLPQADIPLALLSFNIGVEVGQLLFIGAVLTTGFLLKQLAPAFRALFRLGTPARMLGIYVLGSISAFWFVERLAAF